LPSGSATFASLEGKQALVTGGSRGIGAAIARELAAAGATVVVGYRSGKEEAESLAGEIGGKAMQADVAVAEDAKRLVEEAGDVDVLVNNAGYGFAGTVVDTDEEAWDDLMAVNVRGVYLCSKHAIPAMAKNGGGAIVNTASVVAAVGIRNRAAYCASKGAVAALTRAIAIDHVAEGIRCNAVAPGTIDTPYFDEILRKSPVAADSRKALEARQLLGRLGTPEEIAAGILFLASDESRFATGTILTIDGGMTAQ
jgi:meso-butanediol dehydrogenase / (S,S)-butanediol dehydrogenase / diacetyl reductase